MFLQKEVINMTQNKKSYNYDEGAVLIATVMVAVMFVAGMVYNKQSFKQRKLEYQKIEKQQSLKNIKAIAFTQFSR